LGSKIRDLQLRLRRGPRAVIPGVAIIVILWGLTLAASDAAWPIVTVFWAVVGTGVILWVRRDLKRDLGHLSEMLRGYESARKRNEAEVFNIEASAYAEFEEVEDEGACYAFAIDGDRLTFIVGQQYYPEEKFPSHDFAVIHLLDEQGQVVDEMLEKRGPRASPARTIPAATKLELVIPEHLEVINGRLNDLEDLLGSPPSTG
jgi:hypothetical protein